MKSNQSPTTLFVILLAGLVHNTQQTNDFDGFLQRLEVIIEKSPSSCLPFTVQDHLIDNLKKTPNQFKDFCIGYENDPSQNDGPLSSLNKAINLIFYMYKQCAENERDVQLDEIQSKDPIGFLVSLAHYSIDCIPPNFVEYVDEMYKKLPLTDNVKLINEHFDDYLQRLEEIIRTSSPEVLPFMAKHHLIKKMKKTSESFRKLSIENDAKSFLLKHHYEPVSSLEKSIKQIFQAYIKSSGKDYKKKLKRIQLVDPIGFNEYLTARHVSETSSSVKDFIDDFLATMYEEAPIINSSYHLTDFMKFIERLEIWIETASLNILPFKLKVRVTKNLMKTTDNFMDLCIQNDLEAEREYGMFLPVLSLEKAIKSIFSVYKESMTENRCVLEEIEAVDPIGFHVYLTKKDIKISSSTFVDSIYDYQTTLYERVRLFDMRNDDSYIRIPEDIRTSVTSEYNVLSNRAINFFANLTMEQSPEIKFYYIDDYFDVSKYKRHHSDEINDVQLLYGYPGPIDVPHVLCIHYHALSQTVRIYDSSIFKNLDQKQKEIIDILYPFKKDIVYVTPKTIQSETSTCSIFAIIYATMLILKIDPADHSFKLNDVIGDDTLYMRLHIMNMFANRELTLME